MAKKSDDGELIGELRAVRQLLERQPQTMTRAWKNAMATA